MGFDGMVLYYVYYLGFNFWLYVRMQVYPHVFQPKIA